MHQENKADDKENSNTNLENTEKTAVLPLALILVQTHWLGINKNVLPVQKDRSTPASKLPFWDQAKL